MILKTKCFKILLLIGISILLRQFSFAQKEISNFHYSNTGTGYNTGVPLNIPGIPTPNGEISLATLSDSIGNIKFDFCFTDPAGVLLKKGLVYNKNNQIMPGSNLFSNSFYFSSSLIAQFPGINSKYYLFYQAYKPISASSYRWVLMYAVVDMSLSSGLGDVISTDNAIDTIAIDQTLTPYTLLQQKGADNFWIISCKANSDTFYSRFVDQTGVASGKVISKAGTVGFTGISNYVSLNTSPNGNMIAGVRRDNFIHSTICQVFDVNTQTGKITDKVSTKVASDFVFGNLPNTLDAIEFSPDSKLLYWIHSANIPFNGRCYNTYSNFFQQYNLCYTDSNSLSKYCYQKYFSCIPFQFYNPQLAINKKMYLPLYYGPQYARVDFPNHIGDSYNLNLLPFPSGMQSFSTRQFYHAYVQKAIKNSIVYNGGCYPAPLLFSITRDTTERVEWNFGDPASGVNNTASTVSANHIFSSPGIYTITAQIYNASNVLIDSITEVVERKDPAKRFLLPLPVDTVLCEGSSLTIKPQCINGIFEWWVGVNGTPSTYYGIRDSVSQVYSTGGTTQTFYIKMIQNGCNGCEQTDSIRVRVESKPRVNFGPYGAVCVGDSLKLDATFPGASHVWSNGDTSAYIWIKQAGTYWVNSIISTTGCSSSDTITITQYPGVQVNLPKDTILCQGESLVLIPQFVNSSGHTWNGTSNNSDSLLVTASGKYWVTATNLYGCIASDTINVTFKTAPVFTLGNDSTICGGTLLSLTPSPIQPNVNYLWSTNSTGNSIAVTTAGAYWLRLTSTINGCQWQDTIDINFKTLPGYSLGPDKSICEKDTVVLNATVAGASAYLWNTGVIFPSIKAFQTNIYWCDVNKDGCIYRDSITISVKPLPVVNLGNDVTLCEGTNLLLDASNINATYLWQDKSTNASFLVKQEGRYYVAVDKQNCFARDTINVFYNLKPVFSLGPDQSFCDGMIITLDPGLSNVRYLWQDGSFDSKYVVNAPGLYYLTATNNCGTKTDSVYIAKGVCKFYIPNTFTPNGDGRNDFFRAFFGENVTAFVMQVFNRYGELIFESKDKNKGWDGKYKGSVQPFGTYVWVINYSTGNNSNKEVLKGIVFLAR